MPYSTYDVCIYLFMIGPITYLYFFVTTRKCKVVRDYSCNWNCSIVIYDFIIVAIPIFVLFFIIMNIYAANFLYSYKGDDLQLATAAAVSQTGFSQFLLTVFCIWTSWVAGTGAVVAKIPSSALAITIYFTIISIAGVMGISLFFFSVYYLYLYL